MRLFRDTPSFDFMGRRRGAVIFSAVLILVSFVEVGIRGLNFGIEFTGGVLLEVTYPQAADLERVRTILDETGYPGAQVQGFGTARDVLIRLPPVEEGEEAAALRDEVAAALRAEEPGVQLMPADFIGRSVGADLAEQGGLALLFALILTFGYIMLRFRWKFAAGAIAALVHDVVVTVGVFSLTGLSFDLPVLAALLAVIGYSLNDTIVVYDRIRENFRTIRRGTPEQIVNTSVNQTLARTLVTGVTTLLVLLALYIIGGEALAGFSVALIVGILIGTFSSIYVASAAALFLDVSQADLIPPKREEEAGDVP